MSESVLEEYALPTESRPNDIQWRFFVDGAIHRAMERMWERIEVTMASIRGPDPDYVPPPVTVQDLEQLIRKVAREHEPGIQIRNTGRSGPPRWVNKVVLGVAITIIAAAITSTATVILSVSSIRTRIEDYIKSNDQRLERDERQIDDTQKRLDRGAGLPP